MLLHVEITTNLLFHYNLYRMYTDVLINQHPLKSNEKKKEGLIKQFSQTIINAIGLVKREIIKEIPNKKAGQGVCSYSEADMLFIEKAILIIEENIDDPNLDVENFAHQIGMSRAHLYRKMHEVTGLTVKEFIRTTRLKKASGLLLTRKHNVSEIASLMGFNSVSYFTKSFHDFYGISPSRFVEQWDV